MQVADPLYKRYAVIPEDRGQRTEDSKITAPAAHISYCPLSSVICPLTLLLFVCTRFQVLFHSPSGVLFAFPSRYWFTIGRYHVFSLGGWSPLLQTGFLVSRPTSRQLSTTALFSCTGLSPSVAPLSSGF